MLGEEGREVAADDLRGRPPERLGVDERRPLGCPRRAGSAGSSPSAAGLAGPAGTGSARPAPARGGDRLGGRVGLLGGDSTLLEREAGRVARGPNVDFADTPVRMGRSGGSHARPRRGREARAFEPRQRHGTVGAGSSRRGDLQLAVGERERVVPGRARSRGPQAARAIAELAVCAEQLERRVLGSDDRRPRRPARKSSTSWARVSKRELVEGKRPPGSARNARRRSSRPRRRARPRASASARPPRPGRGSRARREGRRPEPRRARAARGRMKARRRRP